MTLTVGDRVVVLPQPGRGLDYPAIIERISDGWAVVRPVNVALSSPAWANSKRARRVKIGKLVAAPLR